MSQETPILRPNSTDRDRCESAPAAAIHHRHRGSSIAALLRDHLLPLLIGRDADAIEAIWRDLLFSTHATSVGTHHLARARRHRHRAVGSLLPASEASTAMLAGGARTSLPLYTTGGGWLHLEPAALVDDALRRRRKVSAAPKSRSARPHVAEDVARLGAVRGAVGAD